MPQNSINVHGIMPVASWHLIPVQNQFGERERFMVPSVHLAGQRREAGWFLLY
jgi:hypothetical protein